MDKIPEIKSKHKVYETRDSKLAAFLISQGCRYLPELCMVADYRDKPNAPKGPPIAMIRFEETPEVYRLAALWNDPDIVTKEPDSPAATVRAYDAWHRHLIDEIKKAQAQVIVKDGQKVWFINGPRHRK